MGMVFSGKKKSEITVNLGGTLSDFKGPVRPDLSTRSRAGAG
jgi:hypothetical protein